MKKINQWFCYKMAYYYMKIEAMSALGIFANISTKIPQGLSTATHLTQSRPWHALTRIVVPIFIGFQQENYSWTLVRNPHVQICLAYKLKFDISIKLFCSY